MSFDYDRLRELTDEHTPGQWEVEQFEEQYAGCPPNTKFYLDSDDMQGIAVCEASDRYYEQAKTNFEFMALAPDMARELLRQRRELVDLCALMVSHADSLHLDGHYYAAKHIFNHANRLTRILEGDTE